MTAPEPAVEMKLWRLQRLGVEAFRRRSPVNFPKHSHDEWQISWGVDRWWHRHAFHDATAGQVVVIPPGEVHATDRPGRPAGTMRSFYIADSTVQSLAQVAGGAAEDLAAALAVRESSRLVLWFGMLWRLTTGPASVLEQSAALHGLVAALAHRCGWAEVDLPLVGAEPRAVARARDFLHAYPTDEVHLSDLADVAGLSPFALNRAFRQAVGVPPHAYQVQLRVRKARSLLHTGASITEAADRAGFADQSHLGRHFKRLVALSPGEYRRAALREHVAESGDDPCTP